MEDLMVLETEDNQYIGQLEWDGECLKVLTGRRGQPPLIRLDQVVSVTPAREHGGVLWLKRRA